jgi:pectinesterase
LGVLLFGLFVINNFVSEGSIPLDTTFTLQRALNTIKGNYPNAKIVPSIVPSNVRAEFNLVYTTLKNTPYGDRDLQLDIFRPKKEGKFPALIMIHGGGWRSGNKIMEHPMAELVAAKGYVTIPVEYRLSLEAKYPNAVFDIKAAIRWIKANADKYSVDTTRIAIEGNSAGGQLAALVGMTNGIAKFEGAEGITAGTSNVQAVVDIDGVLDFLAPGSLNLVRKPDSPDCAWLGGCFTEKPETWKEASSIFWVSKNSIPIVFITSSQPRFTAGMSEMIDLLNQNGIYSERHNIEGSPHTFWLFDPWFEPTVSYMVSYLNRVFYKPNH